MKKMLATLRRSSADKNRKSQVPPSSTAVKHSTSTTTKKRAEKKKSSSSSTTSSDSDELEPAPKFTPIRFFGFQMGARPSKPEKSDRNKAKSPAITDKSESPDSKKPATVRPVKVPDSPISQGSTASEKLAKYSTPSASPKANSRPAKKQTPSPLVTTETKSTAGVKKETPEKVKSKELTNIFDRGGVVSKPGGLSPKSPPHKNGDISRSQSVRTPVTQQSSRQPTNKISNQTTTPLQKSSMTKSPEGETTALKTNTAGSSPRQPREEILFSSTIGKKKTRKLPNLADFEHQVGIKKTDSTEFSDGGVISGEDLNKEDISELERAEKMLEASIAAGKTKNVLPEKEGETVRQELTFEGDVPGEKKTIIKEITKKRVSNPGKLPKEFLAQMDKKGGVYHIYETRTRMTTTRLQGHDTSEFSNMDAEDLLNHLSPREIDELANDVDPDDPMLPPSERCVTLTKKAPTGPLNRRNLLKYLEQQSINEEDWEEPVPFVKQTRGKVWKPKEIQRDEYRVTIDLPEEYEKALDNASESDLVDIAGILELHSLVNQTQYNNTLKTLSTEGGGFRAIAKGDKLKILPPEPPNTTDPESSLRSLEKNDPALVSLNLNNIRDISPSNYLSICRSLKHNTHIENLSLVNTRMTDTIAKVLADSIRDNQSLRSLNLESNALSPDAIVYIFGAICDNPNIREFRASNQRNTYLGNKAEMEIAALMAHNYHLLRLGLTFNVADARVRIASYLKRNQDALRIKRRQSQT